MGCRGPTQFRRWLMGKSEAKRFLALTLTIALTGCASGSGTPPSKTGTPTTHTYADARGAAETLWADYRGRANRQTATTNILYVWLSAIGAAIIGLGVTGTSGVPITALGLGGAYSYGLGTWFAKPEHLVVYK